MTTSQRQDYRLARVRPQYFRLMEPIIQAIPAVGESEASHPAGRPSTPSVTDDSREQLSKADNVIIHVRS